MRDGARRVCRAHRFKVGEIESRRHGRPQERVGAARHEPGSLPHARGNDRLRQHPRREVRAHQQHFITSIREKEHHLDRCPEIEMEHLVARQPCIDEKEPGVNR